MNYILYVMMLFYMLSKAWASLQAEQQWKEFHEAAQERRRLNQLLKSQEALVEER